MGAKMKCGDCGGELLETAKFCSECGSKVADADRDASEPEGNGSKTALVKQYAVDVTHEAAELSKTALKSDLGKKIAAGAAIGAVVAIPVPFIGPGLGAVVGAGVVAFRRLTK